MCPAVKPRGVDVDANDVAAFQGELEGTNSTSNIVYWDSMLIVVVAHPVDSGIVPRDVKSRGIDYIYTSVCVGVRVNPN